MKILVINCHPDNRGDEAAVHAMVDEISAAYPGVEITLAIENRFEQLVNHYDEYKKYLCNKHTFMKSEAHKTTDILATVLERKEKAQ